MSCSLFYSELNWLFTVVVIVRELTKPKKTGLSENPGPAKVFAEPSGRKCSRYQKTEKLKGRTLVCLVHSK